MSHGADVLYDLRRRLQCLLDCPFDPPCCHTGGLDPTCEPGHELPGTSQRGPGARAIGLKLPDSIPYLWQGSGRSAWTGLRAVRPPLKSGPICLRVFDKARRVSLKGRRLAPRELLSPSGHSYGTYLEWIDLTALSTCSYRTILRGTRRTVWRLLGACLGLAGAVPCREAAMQSLHQGKSAGLNCPPRQTCRSSSRQSHGSAPSFLRLALDCISLFSPVILGPTTWGLSSGPAKTFKTGRRRSFMLEYESLSRCRVSKANTNSCTCGPMIPILMHDQCP